MLKRDSILQASQARMRHIFSHSDHLEHVGSLNKFSRFISDKPSNLWRMFVGCLQYFSESFIRAGLLGIGSGVMLEGLHVLLQVRDTRLAVVSPPFQSGTLNLKPTQSGNDFWVPQFLGIVESVGASDVFAIIKDHPSLLNSFEPLLYVDHAAGM